MLNLIYVSSKSVIAKIIADNDLKDDELKITDIKSWIGEAMEHIGAIQQYEKKHDVIKICGHQAPLPCNVHQLDQIAYSYSGCDGWMPMVKSSGAFTAFPKSNCSGENCEGGCCGNKPSMIIHDTVLFGLVKDLYNLTNDREALDILNENPNVRQTLGCLVDQFTVPGGKPWLPNGLLMYTLKPGYIVTAPHIGYVAVSYYGILTDEEGLPMIPDSVSYQEAIYWYVTKKLMYPKYLKGLLNGNVYHEMQQSWNYYRKLAYGEAMMPTVDDLDAIKNTQTLLPELYHHDSFFGNMGAPNLKYTYYNI